MNCFKIIIILFYLNNNINNLFYIEYLLMEQESILLLLSFLFNIFLLIERTFKYYLKHIKKSKCCGSEIEVNENVIDEV
jgi:hypothetical protein